MGGAESLEPGGGKPQSQKGETANENWNTSCFDTFIVIVCSSSGKNQEPQTKQQAEVRIDRLLEECDKNTGKEHYQDALADIEEILGLCGKFNLRQDEIWDFTDRKHFILQKSGEYGEALKVAFELEGMPLETGNRKSPWNYLKIADS